MDRDTSAAEFASAGRIENSPENPSSVATPGLRRTAIAASALAHALLLVALVGLFRPALLPEEPVIQVALLADDRGSAGTAGGQGGAGERATDSAPARETDATAAALPEAAREAPPHAAAEPRQISAPESTAAKAALPAAPPHKPSPPQPRKLASRKQPPPAAPHTARGDVAGSPSQTAPRFAGTPGTQSGPVGGAARGQAAQGAGRGAIGTAPREGPGDDYLDRLQHWLERFKYYPKTAQRQKEAGELIVAFTILRDGTIIHPQVEQSSGFPLLDQAALQMLHDASPVPPLPETYPAASATLSMPVDYSLGFFERLF